jgi:hypothetical protein
VRPLRDVVVGLTETEVRELELPLRALLRNCQARGLAPDAAVYRLANDLTAVRRALDAACSDRNSDDVPSVAEPRRPGELGVTETAERLGIDPRAVRGRIQRNTLPARRGPRGEWLIDEEHLHT